MILLVCFNKIKSFLLTFLALFRRALCFRKRSNSQSDRDEPLSMIVVANESPNYGKKSDTVMRDWNSWDNSPKTVEEHIEVYREKLAKPPTPPVNTEDKNIDLLFSELEPNIIKQARVLVKDKVNKVDDTPNFSRLEAKAADIPIIGELQDMEDDDHSAGWEVNEHNTKQLIREKRKEIRAQKHNKQKLNVNPGLAAEKISR